MIGPCIGCVVVAMAESRVKVEHDPNAQKFYVNFEEGILRKSCHPLKNHCNHLLRKMGGKMC